MKDRKGKQGKRRQPSELPTPRQVAGADVNNTMGRSEAVVCLVLVCLTVAAFIQALQYGFIVLDDGDYVANNPMIRKGLSIEGLRWAMSTLDAGFWHPLTWLSYLLDFELYGLNPSGYHFTNLLLHAAAASLLFLALRGLTGSLWASAAVSAFFAVHPLRVESVVWIAERKDVLSAFFWMLTLVLYARYVRRPGWGRYGWVTLSLLLGLMSKPMLVTLPVILLLLDHWPLRRLGARTVFDPVLKTARTPVRLIVEKVPWLAMSALFSGLTIIAEDRFGAIAHHVPFPVRLANAAVSGAEYIRMLLWPVDLSIYYPLQGMPEMWKFMGATALLAAFTAAAIYGARRAPYALTGWFWYLVSLAPVIGIIQLGSHTMADRFTYIPHVGLLIALVWGAGDLSRTWPRRREILAAAGTLALFALFSLTWMQVRLWQSDYTLYAHALRVVSQNHRAHMLMGLAFLRDGQTEEGFSHLREVIRLRPDLPDNHIAVGNLLLKQGRTAEAKNLFQSGLRVDPGMWYAHSNLGNILLSEGNTTEAVRHLREAARLRPNDPKVLSGLGDACVATGQIKEAIGLYERALRLHPSMPEVQYNLGLILASQGRLDESIAHFREALRLKPDYAKAHNNLGSALMLKGSTDEAIRHFEEAVRIDPDYRIARENLRDAQAQQKRGLKAGI